MIPNWKLEIPEITNKIEAIQNLNSSSNDSILQEKSLQSRLHYLQSLEDDFWAQRAKSNWINLRDKNTRFFHTAATNRRQKNYIHSLSCRGSISNNPEDISKEFIVYFVNIFMCSNPPPIPNNIFDLVKTIDINDNDFLRSKPTLEELKDIILTMKPTKVSRPDGFPALFYQKGWNTLNQDILCFTNSFLII